MADLATSVGILAMVMEADQTGTTAHKDRMRYKRGDIVDIYPPGSTFWKPPFPPWLFIDVTGVPMTVEEIKARYTQMETTDALDPDGNPIQIPYRRRIYWVDLDALPVPNRNDLASARYTVIAWNKARSAIKNKITGQPEG